MEHKFEIGENHRRPGFTSNLTIVEEAAERMLFGDAAAKRLALLC